MPVPVLLTLNAVVDLWFTLPNFVRYGVYDLDGLKWTFLNAASKLFMSNIPEDAVWLSFSLVELTTPTTLCT